MIRLKDLLSEKITGTPPTWKWEGNIKVRSGKLYFPDKSMTSFPRDIRIEFVHKHKEATLRHESGGYSIEFDNRWDKSFKTLEDAVKYLNKEKFNYDGIDDAW